MKTTEPSEPSPRRGFDPVEQGIEAIRRGEIIIVVDDEHRENEGDLVCAADAVSPEAINFMVTHGRGLVCLAIVESMARRLELAPMNPGASDDAYCTAWLESLDARVGVTTGISAYDRARTIQAAVSGKARRADFRFPGHVFPLQAAPDGVLERAGHTEAAVDLARLAHRAPAGVICEILRDDGCMARLPDLRDFAGQHNLRMISIEELTAFRRRTGGCPASPGPNETGEAPAHHQDEHAGLSMKGGGPRSSGQRF